MRRRTVVDGSPVTLPPEPLEQWQIDALNRYNESVTGEALLPTPPEPEELEDAG
jgi:hypothetical protein